MEKFQRTIPLAEGANGHYHKSSLSNNLEAAVRCHRLLSELGKTSLEVRSNILDKQEKIGLKRHLK